MLDWIALADPKILPDPSVRLYWLLKSFIIDDKGQDGSRVVQIVQEDLARMLHRSVDSIQRALKPLYALGLVEDRERRKVSVQESGQKKPTVTTLLIMQINEAEPPPGYAGWVRPFDARKDVRAARDATKDARIAPGQSDTASVRRQSDQEIVDNSASGHAPPGSVPASNTADDLQGDVSAGQCDTANLPESGANLRQNGADLRCIGSKSFGSNLLEELQDTLGPPPLFAVPPDNSGSAAEPDGPVSAHIDALFEDFYDAYPRRVGRKEARRRFEAALKDGAQARELIDGARTYAKAMVGTAARYVAHPSTWLHQRRWTDEHPAPESQPVAVNGWRPYQNPDPAAYHEDY